MGFGAIGGMNTSIKNNRMLLRNHNREKFKNGLGVIKTEKVEFNLPESSPQLLRAIREKMQLENEQLQKKKTIVFLVIVLTLFVVVTAIIP